MEYQKPFSKLASSLIDGIEDKYFVCRFCDLLIEDGKECRCGEAACSSCIKNNLCGTCNSQYTPSHKALIRILGKTIVNCPNKCGQQFKFSDKVSHLS